MTTEIKKLKKEYLKLNKEYRKKLNKLHKVVCQGAWDYQDMTEYFIMYFEWMKKSFEIAYNTLIDTDEAKEIINKLDESIKAYHDWMNHEFEIDTYDSLEEYVKDHKRKLDKFWDLIKENIERWWY